MMGLVPTISRFLGISIAMYFDDHGPSHFHARHADGSAKIRIDTLEVIDSNLDVASCASCSRGRNCTKTMHQDELSDNWHRARAGETLQSIEPLR